MLTLQALGADHVLRSSLGSQAVGTESPACPVGPGWRLPARPASGPLPAAAPAPAPDLVGGPG